jgi:hypothetical protein
MAMSADITPKILPSIQNLPANKAAAMRLFQRHRAAINLLFWRLRPYSRHQPLASAPALAACRKLTIFRPWHRPLPLVGQSQVDWRQCMNRKLTFPLLAGLAALALAGCGYSPGSRALSGGAIGAGTGAIVGAVTGIGPGTGALIGGGVGALAGAATNPNDVNLGRPLVGN